MIFCGFEYQIYSLIEAAKGVFTKTVALLDMKKGHLID